jgi:alpha-beta hydrolase superfamily lysophospholipase
VVLPGRGEHAGVYERFGTRLAADGYAVHALDEASVDRVASIGTGAERPFVVAGSDTGALEALRIAVDLSTVDGLVLAGVPATAGPATGWADEIAARTGCPVHQARLRADERFRAGRLRAPVPVRLVEDAGAARTGKPALVFHGEADPVSPVEAARAALDRLPGGELLIVHSGRHDVLNDAGHRSVAAHVVLFLERLRAGAPVVSIEPRERLEDR